ncbi:MAG: glycosyltransferase family 9 protein [Cyclobacteriaceae bacterium]|nr:glycosyltransferase family 9 protein [Cyclobacteriaceae bacterium]UYN87174.1 MAG: glycosyltransferase family 9 protein [Cyclobacteriaceae bacterium]
MRKILILRFSAMGDVVLLVPVIRSLVAAYPDVEVKVVTRPKFAAFFEGIARVLVYEADVDKKYAGFFGIRKLFITLLARANYSVVIDMHDHVRTMVLRNLFKLAGKKVLVFKKGRAEKKAFVRRERKIVKPLPHTVERYREVLQRAGFDFPIIPGPYLIPSTESKNIVAEWLNKNQFIKKEPWVGIAPFALHPSKIWPIANYPVLIDSLIKKHSTKIFLFGGGEIEIDYFNDLHELFPEHCVVVAGQLKLQQEIALMHQLDLMICTDSSNMHLAALCSTPLLSIWGGTHPDVGFAPYGKGKESILQTSRDELPCRPCSVFGTKTCHRGDFACLTSITAENVFTRATHLLQRA